jgi:hypothetical protein
MKTLLLFTILAANVGKPKPPTKVGLEQCRITWTSLVTGASGHGMWLPKREIPNDEWVAYINNKFPQIRHSIECRVVK